MQNNKKTVLVFIVLAVIGIIFYFAVSLIPKFYLISQHANIYYSALNYYKTNQLDKSVKICSKLLNNNKNIDYQDLTISTCYEFTAEYYLRHKDLNKAELLYKKAIKINYYNKLLKVSMLGKFANCYIQENKDAEAEQILKEILEIYSSTKESHYELVDKENYVTTYLEYGLLKAKQQDYRSSIKYYNKALSLYSKYKLDYKALLQDINFQLAEVYFQARDYNLAEESYKQIILSLEKNDDNPIYLIKSYNRLARIYLTEKEYRLSKKYIQKALNIKENNSVINDQKNYSQLILKQILK
ncbi:MAG: tetratricopeptide repeat protein [bacterium]